MISKEYVKNENTFSYLMYLIFKSGNFSELHLPSLNYVAEVDDLLLIRKQIPIQFEKRIKEIMNILNFSKLTNIKLEKISKKDNEILLELSSIKGKILEDVSLTAKQKQKLIDLFFEYHSEINNPKISISDKYLDFFNEEKLKRTIDEIKNKIKEKEKKEFDSIILDYLNNFLIQNLPRVNYELLEEKNVHGDFSQRNIVLKDNSFSVIDLDMAHKGYIELEFLKFLNHLFEFGSKQYMAQLNNAIKKNSLKWKINENYFKAYLRHKLMDLSVIKSAYFSNNKKYSELQNHILERINFNKRLVNNFEKYSKIFNGVN